MSLIAVSLLVGSVHADVVTAWNSAALDAIRNAKTSPPVASRALAILHAAIYDAVNGITRTHEPYFVTSRVPASASEEAAASTAAHHALVALFPSFADEFDALHSLILATVADSPHEQAGVIWGTHVAEQILAWRARDGATRELAPPANAGPGSWVPTPPGFGAYLLPQWGLLTPFVMESGDQFRPPGPPELTSVEWATDYNGVKALGAKLGSTRTEEQTIIALFWADGAGTETPAGHWNRIAQDLAGAHGNSMEANARLFALLNLAMADAAICAWDTKYTFNFWRPITAIRDALLDNNPATEPDPNWESLIVTPPFPDYLSGHSTFSAAAAAVLAGFYGTDNLSFETGSDGLPGMTRSFSSLSEAAAEAAASRLYGGIHFASAIEDGLVAGAQIGTWTLTHYLTSKHNRSRK